ncbi:hypothetical protein WAX74_04735 [Psychrobacillus sp. FJAT-51614]|uniref:DUF4083 domain-containing protein n=1 Tax=Psychrobacillus mangrovi TaxID=3117745 RepID=A0ABU8F1T5_9BACI
MDIFLAFLPLIFWLLVFAGIIIAIVRAIKRSNRNRNSDSGRRIIELEKENKRLKENKNI